jgi:nitrilase
MKSMQAFKVAAVQASPVFMNREATIEKSVTLLKQAAKEGAKLVVFPETFVPTYPMWVWAVPPNANAQISALHGEYMAQSVDLTKDHLAPLQRAAKETGTIVTIGISEVHSAAGGNSLLNSNICIGADGSIIGNHRKLVPTAPERLIWAMGDGSTLRTFDTTLGKFGGLICWENYMPLARYAMYADGAEVMITPTWDEGETWEASMRHIAKEGRVYVVSSSIVMRTDEIPERYKLRDLFVDPENPYFKVGGSMIVDPSGKILAGPLNNEEGILYADVDPALLLSLKWNLDVTGHYSRPDVFHFSVDRSVKLPMMDKV